MIGKICNICFNGTFGPLGNRPNARCLACDSLERTRLMWLYVQQYSTLDCTTKVLHFAPERGIYSALMKHIKAENYIGSDISCEQYDFVENFKNIDLTRDLECFEDNEFDLILHSHVFEHIPCNVAYILYHIHRILKPSGKHICVIPFMGGAYDECFDDLLPGEATRRFGQSDHVRRFGTRHIESSLGCIIKLPETVDAEAEFGRECLTRYNIPPSCWTGFHPSTVLCLEKRDYRLLPG